MCPFLCLELLTCMYNCACARMYALPCVGQNRWSRTFLKPLFSSENYYTKHIVTSKRSDTDDVCVCVCLQGGGKRKCGLPVRLKEGCHTHTHTYRRMTVYGSTCPLRSTALQQHPSTQIELQGTGRWQTSVHTRKRGKCSLCVLCGFAHMWATKFVCHCKITKDWICLSL